MGGVGGVIDTAPVYLIVYFFISPHYFLTKFL